MIFEIQRIYIYTYDYEHPIHFSLFICSFKLELKRLTIVSLLEDFAFLTCSVIISSSEVFKAWHISRLSCPTISSVEKKSHQQNQTTRKPNQRIHPQSIEKSGEHQACKNILLILCIKIIHSHI